VGEHPVGDPVERGIGIKPSDRRSAIGRGGSCGAGGQQRKRGYAAQRSKRLAAGEISVVLSHGGKV